MLNPFIYALGWSVCLYGQMQGSIRSPSNGLTNDFAGMMKWLRVQSDKLVYRAFFSLILYPTLIQFTINKVGPPLQAAGLTIAVWAFAGFAGFSANTAIHQILGMIPAMRAEIPELAPTDSLLERRAAGEPDDPPKP